MFWGARNVDGRGFDKDENRPTNLPKYHLYEKQTKHSDKKRLKIFWMKVGF